MESFKDTTSVRFASPLFSGLIYAFITMAVCSLLYSMVLALTKQSEESLSFFAYLIHIISITIGSYVCGKRTNKKGWYHGGILGVLYAAIVILVGFLTFNHGFSFSTLLAVIAAYFIGATGGIVGVNQTK